MKPSKPSPVERPALDSIPMHEGCAVMRCKRCMDANDVLFDMLYAALGDGEDWLGRYHSWLKRENINPETEGGWWTRSALTEANADKFIAKYQGEQP